MAKKFYISAIIFSLGFFHLGSPNSSSAWSRNVYHIGGILPLSGPRSTVGASQKRSLEMLLELMNKRGGVNKHLLKLEILDSGGLPQKASAMTSRLILEKKVLAIIGPSTTSETMAVIPVAENYKVPLFSSGSGPEISEPPRPWVFQTAPRRTLRIDAALKDIKQQGLTKIALSGPTFFEEMPSYIEAQAKRLNLTIVDTAIYGPDVSEDGIVVAYSRIDTAAQAIVNYDPRIEFSSENWDSALSRRKDALYVVFSMIRKLNMSPVFPKQGNVRLIAPTFLLTVLLKTSFPKHNDIVKTFAKNYIEKYGERISIHDAPMHDAFSMLVRALETVGPNKDKIRDYIEGMPEFLGMTGIFKFSKENHNGVSPNVYGTTTVNKDNGCADKLHKCPESDDCVENLDDCPKSST